MLKVNIQVAKTMFFDRQAVLTPAEKAEKTVLSRFGAYCRRIARNSIKQAPAPGVYSQPGSPPLKHGVAMGYAGYGDTIFFLWDRSTHSVVIGPILLQPGGTRSGAFLQRLGVLHGRNLNYSGDNPVPATLEHGGFTTFRGRRVYIRPRPHMQPAFKKAQEKLPPMLSDCIMRETSHAATISIAA